MSRRKLLTIRSRELGSRPVLLFDRYSSQSASETAQLLRRQLMPRRNCHTCCSRAGVWTTWVGRRHEAARSLRPHWCGLIETSGGESAPPQTMLLRVSCSRAFSVSLDLRHRRCVSVAGCARYFFVKCSTSAKVRGSASSPPLPQSLRKTFEILLHVLAPA